MKVLYTSRVSVSSGRDGGAVSSDGKLDLRLAFPTELGGRGDAANPEQLFVAGFAACFASSVKAAAATFKRSAPGLRIDAEADLAANDDGSFAIAGVRFVLHGIDFGDQADAVIAEAKRICAYSTATRGNLRFDVAVATV